MKTRTAIVIAIAWTASLLGTGLWAQSSTAGVQQVPAPMVHMGEDFGPIITGDSLGFQPVGAPPEAGRITGKLMVKVDGIWLEARFPTTMIREPDQQ